MKIQKEFEQREKNGVPYLVIPAFERTGVVEHGFSTRLGGVSEGCFASMNLGVTRGDDPAKVEENYRIFCAAIGVDPKRVVLSQQTHTDNIRVVTEADCGKGLYRERDYTDVDGLITNEPNIPLVTFFADCVPLVFLDPVKRVLASVHSGWRGTVRKIGTKAIRMMVEQYGCQVEDILAAIGPCIGPCHYEVDEPCAQEFQKAYPEDLDFILEELDTPGKYLLDLPMANVIQFLDCGILEEHITMSNRCTYCEPELFFSHRQTGDARGNLAMVIQLRPKKGDF